MLVLSQSWKLCAPSLPACVFGFLAGCAPGAVSTETEGFGPADLQVAGRNKVLQQNLRNLGVGSQKILLKFAFDGHG